MLRGQGTAVTASQNWSTCSLEHMWKDRQAHHGSAAPPWLAAARHHKATQLLCASETAVSQWISPVFVSKRLELLASSVVHLLQRQNSSVMYAGCQLPHTQREDRQMSAHRDPECSASDNVRAKRSETICSVLSSLVRQGTASLAWVHGLNIVCKQTTNTITCRSQNAKD